MTARAAQAVQVIRRSDHVETVQRGCGPSFLRAQGGTGPAGDLAAAGVGSAELRVRVAEKHRADRSARAVHGAGLVMGDPDEFLRGARTLCASATAGRDQ